MSEGNFSPPPQKWPAGKSPQLCRCHHWRPHEFGCWTSCPAHQGPGWCRIGPGSPHCTAGGDVQTLVHLLKDLTSLTQTWGSDLVQILGLDHPGCQPKITGTKKYGNSCRNNHRFEDGGTSQEERPLNQTIKLQSCLEEAPLTACNGPQLFPWDANSQWLRRLGKIEVIIAP